MANGMTPKPMQLKRAPRLYHTKSKTGCSRCRERRVKCDESRPACNDCYRHNVTCEYDRPLRSAAADPTLAYTRQTPRAPGAPEDASSSSRNMSMSRSRSRSSGYADNSYSGNSHITSASLQSPSVGVSLRQVRWEMRAMHHFTTSTSRTLPGSHLADIRGCWMQCVPVMALDYEPLLSELVALSCLHLASSGSQGQDPGLLACRATYLDAALREHRQTLCQLSNRTADAACFTSILLLVDAFTVLRDRPLEPYEPPVQWLWIVQGTRSVFDAAYDMVKADPASSIMTIISSANFALPSHPESLLSEPAHADYFRHLLPEQDPYTDWRDPVDDTFETYKGAVAYIGSLWAAVSAGEPPLALCRRLMSFPCLIPHRFLEFVQEKEPRALVILSYFFALSIHARSVWWIQDTPQREVYAIRDCIPKSMLHLMDWPLRVVAEAKTR